MGIVWLARDEELERDVALKFLPDLMIQDRALLDQLKHETKRCLELTHPHIVRIHDFVHDERSGCISMEYVDGETLSNLRAEKKQKIIEPHELSGWITQLCEALDYAHNHAKVIHRDLKPVNLMVKQRDDLKITDFGIAKFLPRVADETSDTFTGVPLGTLRYMSPEQLRAGALSRNWDLWALAVIAYEVLCGIHPFATAEVATLPGAILEAKVAPVADYLPSSPPRFQDFFRHVLAAEESNRPASVDAFWSDLKTALSPA